jgi:CHAD domain-containing protein
MHRSAGAVPSSIEALANGLPPAERAPAPAGSPARIRLVKAFETAIDDAMHAAATVERAPTEAVHGFRRSTRRARAILAAVAQDIPTAARLEIRSALRSAIRDTGAMRDRDVLPTTLAALPPHPETQEARAAIETALLVDRARQRKPLSRVRLLAVAAARLGLLPDRFAASLRGDVGVEDVVLGLGRLARRARRSVRTSEADPGEVALAHVARKRVRQCASALDALLGEQRPCAQLARELARLSTKLGDTLDLELLATFARSRGAVQAGASHAELIDQVERRLRRRRPKLLERAARLLKRRRWKSERLLAPEVR